MSGRLKRKLGELGVDLSSNRANESFCLIGTPLPPLEKSKDTGEFVPLWKQEVRDEKGRRRLHGAFTGGFSAGYFNTVGSKEGWAPATFVSSRGDRAKQKTARPEDFMDDEDLQELKDSRKIVDDADEMDLSGANRNLEEPEKDSIAAALEASMLPPPTDSAGARILKKMGWRIGQGIGPRMTLRQRKKQDMEFSFGGKVTSDLANIPSDDEEASKHTYARRDTKLLLVNRKDNSYGLGYSPGMGLNESLGVKGAADNTADPRISSGFGLGALNDADEDDLDIYDGGNSNSRRHEAYDNVERDSEDTTVIGGRTEKGRKQAARPSSSPQFFRDGQPVLAGFTLSDKPVSEDLWFPLPDIPKGWTPDPRRVWGNNENKENEQGRTVSKGSRTWISADERGMILGETPLPSAPKSVFEFMSQKDRERLQKIAAGNPQSSLGGPSAPGSSQPPSAPSQPATIHIPRTEPHVAQAALRGFQPFTSDPIKQARYNTYLQSQIGTDASGPPLTPTPTQHIDEFNKEVQDYAKAALLFMPVSGAMAGRFTSATAIEHGPKIHEGLHIPAVKENDAKEDQPRETELENVNPKAHAARMGMYGPLTREIKLWQPAKLLCKRFKVKDPDPVPETPADVPGSTSTAWQEQADMSAAGVSGTSTMTTPASTRRNGPRDISNIGLGEDDDQGRDTLTYQRPTMDIFKAIFASDDEDSGDEIEDSTVEAPIPVQQIKDEEPKANALIADKSVLPPQNTVVDIGSFKPTFIPRENRIKKENEKGKDQDKKGKRKKEKEKKAALSFEVDEGGEQSVVRPHKDRPKKKKRKEKREDDGGDDGMWVEKPAPEIVKDLSLPPLAPASTEASENSEGLSKGRKRAVDFL